MLITLANVVLGLAQFVVAGLLAWLLRQLRPWRLGMVRSLPQAAGEPFRCVAGALNLLPIVFALAGGSRLAAATPWAWLAAVLTGAAGGVMLLTLWHLWRAGLCVRRTLRV